MNQVKFGDYLTIQGSILEKGQTQTAVHGYISTSGYTNNEIYLERLPKSVFEDDKNPAERVPKKPEENICSIKNYREYVFQVWPKLDYDAHKKYSKLVEEKTQIQKKLKISKDNVGISEEDQESTKDYLNEIREKIKIAKVRMESEKQNNMKQLDNVKGNYVCYGQEIFLMHADSLSFLNGLVLASGSEKSAFMVQVSKFFQRGMIFKFIPKYKLRKEGEPIQYKDQIQILNVKQECWASFIPSNIIQQDKPIAAPNNYYKSIDFKKNQNRQRVEVFLTKLKDAFWQLHFHSEYVPPQDNSIRGGDLVYLYHTELQGSLTADLNYTNQQGHSEAYIRRYEGEYEQEKYSVASVWEIEVDANKQRGNNVNVSTISTQDKGTTQSYKLRHLLTGKVLSFSQMQQKGKDAQIPCLAKDDLPTLETTSKIQFVSTQGDDKDTMENNLCYLIKINNSFVVANQQIQYSFDKPEKKAQGNQNVNDFKDVTEDMIYKPIPDSEFEIYRDGLVCLEKGGTEENAFQVIKLTEEEKQDIFFVNSSQSILQKFLWKLRAVPQKEPLPRKEMIKKVIQILSDLVFFLVKTESKDPLDCEGIPNQDRQRIMKDFRFIELLVDLLYYPLKLEVYKIKELDQIDPDIVKIFKLCNALINHTIKEYRPNEIYASQWIDLLIFQSVMTEGDCDIGSEETLTELIDNNKKILERIDEVTVNKFLKMLYDEQEDKYVKLVRALVLCNGQPVPNQELISKLLLTGMEAIENDEDDNGEVSINNIDKIMQHKIDPNKPLIIQAIKFMKGEVWVQSPFQDNYGSYIQLMKFQEMGKESPENLEKFHYFVEMITLLSDLCKNRNYIAIGELSHVYKRRVCFEIISNHNFDPSLRRSFVMLVHTMYVDITCFKKFSLPNNIRVWTEIDTIKPIISVLDNQENEDKQQSSFVSPILYVQNHLKGFATGFIAGIAKTKFMSSLKEEENHLTYSILQMIQEFIDFGFFDSDDQLDALLKNLVKVLNSTIDVTNANELEIAEEIVKVFANRTIKGNIPQIIKKTKGKSVQRFNTRYEQTEDNLIVQQCKVLCCNILKKIILIRNDMRVTDFMKKFKTEVDLVTTLKPMGKPSKKKSSMKPLEIETPLNNTVKRRNMSQPPILDKPISNEFGGDRSPLIKDPLSKGEQDFFGSAEEDRRRKIPTLYKSALQLINEIFTQNSIKIRGCLKVDVVAIFQDLTLYQYPDLVNTSFEILNLLFTERQAMQNLLKNVQLLEEPEQIQSYNELKTIQDGLSKIIEKSENWLFKNNDKGITEAVNCELRLQHLSQMLVSKQSGVVMPGVDSINEPDGERLPSVQMKLKENTSLEQKTLVGQLFEEGETRNKNNQELIRNSYLYQQIIDLLKYDAATFTRQRSEQELKQKDFEDNSVFIRVLRQCYKILGRLVTNNKHNQQLLTDLILDFIFKHMRYLPQAQANYVIDPLMEQNPLIIMNDDVCRKFVREIFLCVNTIKPHQPGLAACYIDTLRRIPYINDSIIKENQTLIIDQLTNKENSSLLTPILIKEASFANISKAISEFQKRLESGSEDIIPVPGDVDYFNSLIYLVASICDQKNNATESKAQSYVPLLSLRELLVQFNSCYYVKKCLYFFFFHVYLDTEKEMSEELMGVKKVIISTIQDDFSNIARTLDSQGFSVLSYKGKIPIQKIKLEYIFESLLLCIDTILFKKLLDPDQEKAFLVALFESIIQVSRYPTLTQLEKKKLRGILIQLVQRGFTTIVKIKEQIQNTDVIPNALEIRQVQKNLYENVTTTVQGSNDSVVQLSQKQATLHDIIKKLSVTEEFQEQIRKDFKEFVDYFTGKLTLQDKITLFAQILFSDIKNISLQTFQGLCTIDFSELTSSMIKFMVQNRSSNEFDYVSNELSKKRLQVLRQIIELENPDNSDPVDLWESMDGHDEEILKRQNKLVQQGVIEMIVQLIKDPFAPYDLKEESILLGIALLLGGNPQSQGEFLNQLTSDNKNQFLGTLFDIIVKGVSLIKKNMSKLNKQSEYRLIEKQKEVLSQDQNENNQDFDDKLSDDEVQVEKINDTEDDGQDFIPQNVIEEIQKVRRVYRLLQLFCEGHNNNLQNHLRLQIINKQESGKSIDFIMNTSIFFSNAVKYVNIHSVDLVDQILDFLIEVIQGPCSQNQIIMCRGKVIESCKDLLQKFSGTIETNKDFAILGFNNEENKGRIDSIVNKSFKLLYSLIEGDPSPDILSLLCSTLDFKYLLQILVERYQQLKVTLNVKEDDIEKLVEKIGSHFDESLTEVFDIYLLISTLADKNETIKELLENPTSDQESALQFFKYNTASIEVVFQTNLVRVYYPIQPICRLLSKNTRALLMEDIPRSTPSEKIEGLVDASIYLFDEMEHLAFLKRQIFNFSSNRLQAIMLFSYFLALIINLTILFTYKLTFDGFQKGQNSKDDRVDQVTFILGIIQFVTTLFIIVFWIMINGPLIIKRSWHQIAEEYEKLKKPDEEVRIIDAKYMPLGDAVNVLMTKGPQADEFWKTGTRDFGHMFVSFMYYWRNFQFMMLQGGFIYLLFYVTVSAMGLFLSDIVYCLHLLDIIVRFPTLQNVIKAVTTNIGQLGLTTLLGAVIIYIYAIFAFYFSDISFNTGDVFDSTGASDNENTCTTLFQCYLYTLNKGLVSGGGIGEGVSRPSYSDDTNTFIFRYIFDLTFFMIINITFLNFIFGIIIDTFAQLRDEKQQMEEDKNNVCFICGLSRDEFDQVPGGFNIHIENYHQLWFYVYYIYHLKCKDSTEYNGIESNISDLLARKNTSWFPMLRALSISQEANQDQDSQIDSHFEKLKNGLKDITSKVDKITISRTQVKKAK